MIAHGATVRQDSPNDPATFLNGIHEGSGSSPKLSELTFSSHLTAGLASCPRSAGLFDLGSGVGEPVGFGACLDDRAVEGQAVDDGRAEAGGR